MCGIVGGWWVKPPKDVISRINNSLRKLENRGPDHQGYEKYLLNDGMLILGHTRLSIIDLSEAGHQPMVSSDGRFCIIFNGEIYNYRELRKELSGLGHLFSSDTDTEVLLAAWQEWHVDCLRRLEGMFSFVVYDQERKTLTCVRDAFGIKPFFYEQRGDRFLFASEQRALLELKEERPAANWQRCYDYLTISDYDSNRNTFISGVQHLMPGHWLEVDLLKSGIGEPQMWWEPSTQQTSSLTFNQAVEAVREQFLYNIRLHLRSDVPLGAALSGGVDSSAVVCAMKYVEPDLPIHTFSFIADGFEKCEEKWVDHVNGFVRAIPHKVKASGDDVARDLEAMIFAQGEPFGSTSSYAQHRLFQLVREKGITVTLDGQGADELLAGYFGYPGYRILSLLEGGNFLQVQSFARNWVKWPGRSYKRLLKDLGHVILPESLYQLAQKTISCSFSPDWLETDDLKEAGVKPGIIRYTRSRDGRTRRVIEHLGNSIQHKGLQSLLRSADRNSMAFSIESRVPYLTLPFAELLLSMPEEYLISRTGETKHVFRAAMRGIVPDIILDRKDKIGFATPEKDWLSGIADVAREWLRGSEEVPFLKSEMILKRFDSILEGKSKFDWQVWRWINFVKWYQLIAIK